MVTVRRVASLVNFGQMHAQTTLNKRPDVIRRLRSVANLAFGDSLQPWSSFLGLGRLNSESAHLGSSLSPGELVISGHLGQAG
jgi:hypothetical protein